MEFLLWYSEETSLWIFVLREDATNWRFAYTLVSPLFHFHFSRNFTTILQLRSYHTHLHYQLIKAGSNQKEKRYNIRFVMCDPIRIAAVVCSLLGCHGRLAKEDLVVHSTKNCEESAAQLIS